MRVVFLQSRIRYIKRTHRTEKLWISFNKKKETRQLHIYIYIVVWCYAYRTCRRSFHCRPFCKRLIYELRIDTRWRFGFQQTVFRSLRPFDVSFVKNATGTRLDAITSWKFRTNRNNTRVCRYGTRRDFWKRSDRAARTVSNPRWYLLRRYAEAITCEFNPSVIHTTRG